MLIITKLLCAPLSCYSHDWISVTFECARLGARVISISDSQKKSQKVTHPSNMTIILSLTIQVVVLS
jgi:hypothetical protein